MDSATRIVLGSPRSSSWRYCKRDNIPLAACGFTDVLKKRRWRHSLPCILLWYSLWHCSLMPRLEELPTLVCIFYQIMVRVPFLSSKLSMFPGSVGCLQSFHASKILIVLLASHHKLVWRYKLLPIEMRNRNRVKVECEARLRDRWRGPLPFILYVLYMPDWRRINVDPASRMAWRKPGTVLYCRFCLAWLICWIWCDQNDHSWEKSNPYFSISFVVVCPYTTTVLFILVIRIPLLPKTADAQSVYWLTFCKHSKL